MRKVVITGMGAVSPFGAGVARMMERLFAGDSAVVDMRAAWGKKVRDLACWIGAPVADPPDSRAIDRKFRRTMGPASVLGLLACREALAEAALPPDWLASGRMGVSFASATGSLSAMEALFTGIHKGSVRHLPAGSFFQVMSNTVAANLAHALGIRGRTYSPNSACASSAQAIGLAYDEIESGRQDVVLCGGADELHVAAAAGLDLAQAASWHFNETPQCTPRPFDRDRDGTVCGEGAGALVLESEAVARARGAHILAEVAGYATTTDGGHLSESDAHSMAACIHGALDKAGMQPADIDYVNAHATGTIVGDLAEARALAEVFGASGVPISSLKGAIGHTLGASGALELIAAVLMAHAERVIPTRNLEHPAEECAGLNLPRHLQRRKVRTLMKNSFAFGGINAVLVIKKIRQ